MIENLRNRFEAAKLAGRSFRNSDPTNPYEYFYSFRSNEGAANVAVAVVEQWLRDLATEEVQSQHPDIERAEDLLSLAAKVHELSL